MEQITRLTTTDNEFNPVTQFDQWYARDALLGYHTLSYLARVTRTSSELSQVDQDLAEQQAMDDIVNLNGGLYVKVVGPDVQQQT